VNERPADADTIEETLASSLESLDDAVNYRDWIADLCVPHLGGSLLEIGAGQGTFTEVFVEHGDVCAVEPGAFAAKMLAERFVDDERVDVVVGLTEDVDARRFDAAVMVNVFEHIDDEVAALAAVSERLTDGGRLILWVPAFMLLYGPFDKRLGHHRRYRLRPLVELLEANGFEVIDRRYTNLPGWFSWLLLVRLLRQEPTNVVTVQLFDRFVVPVVRWIESRVCVPFGQSIFLVARRQS